MLLLYLLIGDKGLLVIASRENSRNNSRLLRKFITLRAAICIGLRWWCN